MDNKIYIKQYGLERSGTNYIRRLVELNFAYVDILMHRLGSKHEAQVDFMEWIEESEKNNYLKEPVKNKELRYLVITKNPYAWLTSRIDYMINWREQDINPESEKFIEESINKYNSLNREWLELVNLSDEQGIFVLYENVLKDFKKELENIKEALDLEPLNPIYINEKKVVKPSEEDITRLSSQNFKRDKYIKQYYLEDLTLEQLDIINRNIDWQLVEDMGYNVEELRT